MMPTLFSYDPEAYEAWIIRKKRRPEPGGTRNHQQMFLIVGHLATPLSDAAFPNAALRSS